MIYALDGLLPDLHADTWVAHDANLIGRVVLEAGASVWFGATLRGDNEEIRIGANSNVQENCVLHTDIGFPLVVGDECTIGHKAMLHGCVIGDGSLIGMGTILLNGCHIGQGCLIGAGSLVTEGKQIPDGSFVMGAPARVVRMLDADARTRIRESAAGYVANMRRFRAGLRIHTT